MQNSNLKIYMKNDEIKSIKKRLEEIKQKFEIKRNELRKSQEQYGIIEIINNGYTFRLGNEVEDFNKYFGII